MTYLKNVVDHARSLAEMFGEGEGSRHPAKPSRLVYYSSEKLGAAATPLEALRLSLGNPTYWTAKDLPQIRMLRELEAASGTIDQTVD